MADVTPADKSASDETPAEPETVDSAAVEPAESETATDLAPDVSPAVLDAEPDAPREATAPEEPLHEKPVHEEPVHEEPVHDLVEPAAPVAPAEPVAADSVGAAPVAAETTPVEAVPVTVVAAEAAPIVAPATSVAPQQQVYMPPPIPPKKRGNRGVGILLAIVGAIIFTAVYAGVAGLISFYLGAGRDLFGANFIALVSSTFFWVPVGVFLVALILLVLLLNRAGWWAHILGSLVLAFVVYIGMIGVLLFVGNVLKQSPEPVTFAQLAVNPLVIAAAVVARECSIWIGLAIAARGRRVKGRNIEARAAFEREQEAKRAEYGGAVGAA